MWRRSKNELLIQTAHAHHTSHQPPQTIQQTPVRALLSVVSDHSSSVTSDFGVWTDRPRVAIRFHYGLPGCYCN